MIEKKITVRLTKKDIEILQDLCSDYGETTTNVIKHALHFLFDARINKNYLKKDWLKENEK